MTNLKIHKIIRETLDTCIPGVMLWQVKNEFIVSTSTPTADRQGFCADLDSPAISSKILSILTQCPGDLRGRTNLQRYGFSRTAVVSSEHGYSMRLEMVNEVVSCLEKNYREIELARQRQVIVLKDL